MAFGTVPVEMTAELTKHIESCRFSRVVQEDEIRDMPMAAFIPVANRNLMTFGVLTGEVGGRTLHRLSRELAGAASAVTHLAGLRGENEDDPLGTIEAALVAASFLTNWAIALSEISDTGLYGDGN